MEGLGQFLFDTGLLSRKDLERASDMASESGESLDTTLVRAGFVSADDVRRARAAVHGIPLVQLEPYALSLETLLHIPEALSRAHNAIAYAESPSGLEVALLNMDDVAVLERHLAPKKLRVRLTDGASFKRALLHYQKLLKEHYGAVFSNELSMLNAAGAMGAHNAAFLDAGVRVADALLRLALVQQAHELSLEPGEHVRVRYRIGHGWHDAMSLPRIAHEPLLSRFKSLAGLSAEHATPQSGRFSFFQHEGAPRVTVGVHTTPVVHEGGTGEKLVLSLAHEKSGYSLSALGMRRHIADETRRMIAKGHGLVLVCGRAGQGKTTTLYTLLDEVSAPHKHIGSVEAEVSAVLPLVSQMEIKEEAGLGAAACMRAHLRHSVDVLMLDCPLDAEALHMAAEAANRGVLVLMGVDADSVAEGIEHVLSLGISPELFSAVFAGAVGVRVVPKLCAHSKKEFQLSRDMQRELESRVSVKDVLKELKDDRAIGPHVAWKDMVVYAPEACALCEEGFAGRIGLHEVVPATRTLERRIREGGAVEPTQDEYAADALYKAALGLVEVGAVS
jgi:type IV pilus assembly protein PilB